MSNTLRKSKRQNRGMTYVELIVVLSIFSIITSITLFNYRKFQEKVDLKTLANDMALKIVSAQKFATSGKWAPVGQEPNDPDTWKPSYGVHFKLTSSTTKNFIEFVDLDQDKWYSGPANCAPGGIECLSLVTISKSSYISDLKVYYTGQETPTNLIDLDITFSRPDSVPTFRSNTGINSGVNFAEISIGSPQGVSAKIKVYSSGRIQIN